MLVRSWWKTILMTPIRSIRPTPSPTVTMRRSPFIMALTCAASTDRSGSAMVMSSPITKQTPSRSPSFLDAVSPSPMYWPIGVIARSAPRLKKLIPIISSRAAATKTPSSWRDRFTHGVRDSMSTRKLTGSTERSESLIFSASDCQRSDKMDVCCFIVQKYGLFRENSLYLEK